MNYKQGFSAAVICVMGFSPMVLRSQSTYKVNTFETGNIKLSGTSTLHDWEMNAKNFTGTAQFGFNPANAGQLTSIKALTFSLAVLDLKSKDRGLNANAYKALKTKQYKNIQYKLTSATIQPGKADKYLVKTNGDLSIAGVTKAVSMDVYCVVNKDATITCTGTEHIKMTDYKVKPPTFMLGAMKTGDDLVLDFTMVYNK